MIRAVKADRAAFWKYCIQTAYAAEARSKAKNVPCSVDAYFIDQLLVDQEWRCAVCALPLAAPAAAERQYRKDPFGPSLDRIEPALGYVEGNLRIVNNLVNSAMQEWGLESLLVVLSAMATERLSNRRRRQTINFPAFVE